MTNEENTGIRSFLIKKKLILPKTTIHFDEKKMEVESKKVEFSNIVKIEKMQSYVHNYAFTLFLSFFIIGAVVALLSNIYMVETTYTKMDPAQLELLNRLARLRGGTQSDGLSKTYSYDMWFLFFGPLFNGLFWGGFFGLVGRFIQKLRKQYKVELADGSEVLFYPTKIEERVISEYDWLSDNIHFKS